MIRVIKSNTDAKMDIQAQECERCIHDKIAICISETKESVQKNYPITREQKIITVNASSMNELVTSCIEKILTIDCSSLQTAITDVQELLLKWAEEKLCIRQTRHPDVVVRYFIQKITDQVYKLFEKRITQGKPMIALESEWEKVMTQPRMKTLLTELISKII